MNRSFQKSVLAAAVILCASSVALAGQRITEYKRHLSPWEEKEPKIFDPAELAWTVLRTHNALRAQHKTAPLAWSEKLAQKSADIVSQCKFEHAGPGENLAHTTTDKTPEQLVEVWYSELNEFNYDGHRPHRPEGVIGHFSQVVWKGSEKVGCAATSCPELGTLFLCIYDPPGNVVGRYKENVGDLVPGSYVPERPKELVYH